MIFCDEIFRFLNLEETLYFTKLDIRIVPKQGAALFFDYKYIFDLNMKTQHAGLPIISGQKWIATSWIRGKRYNSNEDPNNRL
jgi:hypothetical protein